ncbi:unnamed protein product [Effrenium voratum]|uniref:Uncharacterized protein n=1 Tax=Effrenium voratum TaxID=2562239 RepID=A0AA36IB07_9DINO|nr:unnamed protein product [Effrenium voratum]
MAGPVNGTSHEDGVGPSQIHRRLKAEFDDVLRTSMQNRLKNLREEVEALCNSLEAAPNGDDEPSPASSASRASAPDTKALCETVAKALRRAKRCSKKPITSYGPSDRQVGKAEPSEKDEALVMEGTTLRATLASLEQSLSSRTKQILALTEQLKVCESARDERTVQAAEAKEQLDTLVSNPKKLEQICEIHLAKRKERVEDMAKDAAQQKQHAKYYQSLAQQQRAFYLQSERISACGGKEAIARHRAGEVALVHQPTSLQDDDTEEMFDVGTAVANPYVCDSWPFEPNVLAKRTPQESSMPTFEEETEDDLKEAERGFRTNPFRSLRFPPGPSGAASDDDDDRYPGTARSL